MTVHSAEIARLFQEYAFFLAIECANPFHIPVYRNADRAIEILSLSLSDMLKDDTAPSRPAETTKAKLHVRFGSVSGP